MVKVVRISDCRMLNHKWDIYSISSKAQGMRWKRRKNVRNKEEKE